MNQAEWEARKRQRRIEELEKEHAVLSGKISQLRQARIIETDATVLFKLEQQLEAAERQRVQLEQDIEQLVSPIPASASPDISPTEDAQPQEPPPQPKRAHPLRTILLAVALLLVSTGIGLWSSGWFPILMPKTVPTPTPAPKPTATPTPDRIAHLRSEPRTVSADEFKKVFGLDENQRPLKYVEHDYDDQGAVVLDHATGLMWQKSGSPNHMPYQDAQAYIKQLNTQKFAGYSDWRLPTIPELISLLEPEKQANGLYINPIFDSNQTWCWSADLQSSLGAAWSFYFNDGSVGANDLRLDDYVRAVRS